MIPIIRAIITEKRSQKSECPITANFAIYRSNQIIMPDCTKARRAARNLPCHILYITRNSPADISITSRPESM